MISKLLINHSSNSISFNNQITTIIKTMGHTITKIRWFKTINIDNSKRRPGELTIELLSQDEKLDVIRIKEPTQDL